MFKTITFSCDKSTNTATYVIYLCGCLLWGLLVTLGEFCLLSWDKNQSVWGDYQNTRNFKLAMAHLQVSFELKHFPFHRGLSTSQLLTQLLCFVSLIYIIIEISGLFFWNCFVFEISWIRTLFCNFWSFSPDKSYRSSVVFWC